MCARCCSQLGPPRPTRVEQQYGFDNWIYGMVGYSGFKGTVGGREQAFSQGLGTTVRSSKFLRATNNNTWGIGFTEDGLLSGPPLTTRASICRSRTAIRSAARAAHPRWHRGDVALSRDHRSRRQVDVHWGYTAAAGHAVYTARSYPKEYWNQSRSSPSQPDTSLASSTCSSAWSQMFAPRIPRT
jgi:hypothetical protein